MSIRRASDAVKYGLVDSSVVRDPQLGIRATAVYAVLCTYASGSDDRRAFPSREVLATALDTSTDTIDRALMELRMAGVLVTQRRKQQTAMHFLHDMGAARVTEFSVDQESAQVRSQDQESAKSGIKSPQNHPARVRTGAEEVVPVSKTKDQTPTPSEPVLAPAIADAPDAADGQLFVIQGDAQKPKDPAQQLCEDWFAGLRVRPAGKGAFPAALASIRAVLKVGHDEQVVRHAVMRLSPPLSIGRIEMEINGKRSTVSPVHDWKEGDTWLEK